MCRLGCPLALACSPFLTDVSLRNTPPFPLPQPLPLATLGTTRRARPCASYPPYFTTPLPSAAVVRLMCRRNYRAQRAAVRASIDAVGRVAAEGVALKERLGLAPPGLAPSATAEGGGGGGNEGGGGREGVSASVPRPPPMPPAAGDGVGHA